jgi:mannose-6-phosphate isomerase-like protein (cupin superfamily)
MHRVVIAIIGTMVFFSFSGVVAGAQNGQPARDGASPAPTDKVAYFPNTDAQAIWQDLEAKQVINKRVMEGGTYSINIRIVKPDSPPLVHAKSIDLWIVQAGTATAITGGELLNPKKGGVVDDTAGSSIRGGVEQPLHPGDMLFIPTGVPHGFKDLKGFRALLIRWEPK